VDVKKASSAPLFYLGTLISSIGSFAFNVSMIAFMLKSGFELWNATAIIGLNRLLFAGVMTSIGHITDRVSARSVVAVTEVIAAGTSLCLYLLWVGADTNYPLFAGLCIARGAVVSFQIGSRAKIAKLLSENSFAGNSKNAIWLNKATQGATLFGGVVGFVIIRYFDFKTAIVLDGLTFIANGFFTILLPDFNHVADPAQLHVSWHQKFSNYFKFNKQAAILDVVLAVSMMGTVAFQSRMAGVTQSWNGLYLASFGLAVWVAGFLENGITSKLRSAPYWIVLGASFIALGALGGPGPATLIVMFIKDLAYWIILHRISAHIQTDTPSRHTGSVASARMTIMISILAVGEIMVGAWIPVVPVSMDGLLRAVIAISVASLLLLGGPKRTVLDERPSF
jgi:MFS family permease